MSSSTMASRKARHEALTGWLFALPREAAFMAEAGQWRNLSV